MTGKARYEKLTGELAFASMEWLSTHARWMLAQGKPFFLTNCDLGLRSHPIAQVLLFYGNLCYVDHRTDNGNRKGYRSPIDHADVIGCHCRYALKRAENSIIGARKAGLPSEETRRQ